MKVANTYLVQLFALVLICLFTACGDDGNNELPIPKGLISEWVVTSYEIDIKSNKSESDSKLLGVFGLMTDRNATYTFTADSKLTIDYSESDNRIFNDITTGKFYLYPNNELLMNMRAPSSENYFILFSLVACKMELQENDMVLTWDYKYNFNNNPEYYISYFDIRNTNFERVTVVKRLRRKSAY
ncbi:hypothetical protein [Dysgonomonas sp. 25]|uniref:hypothetical protein n=1 Tax=Dysgonomonas sp. 25 TaxID=2302933 RepID=UPI0013CF6B9A|nr:hypothetical protein [Dysgonomonas sp. 25]NDV68973.1 hypothetical protein [Dysgonomonas sp. 25]